MPSKWPTPSVKLATLEHYNLISSLGEGSLGEVFYAEDTSKDPPQPVAVKVLHERLLTDWQAVEELRHEAEVLGGLDHPNIIRFVDSKIGPLEAYLVTEYVGGGSLAGVLRPHSDQPPEPLTTKQVTGYLKQITEALYYAHNNNLVHCDLKPENILLDEDGNVKLADFSLATRVNWSPSFLRKSEAAWGTPFYAAPELWDGEVGKVTDIYSLGVILYQLLTGVPPYQGTAEELKEQHRHAPIPTLKENAPDLDYPPALDEVLAEAMAKDPQKRFSSARQLYNRFARALEEAEAKAAGTANAFASPASSVALAPSSPAPATASSTSQPLVTAANSAPATSPVKWTISSSVTALPSLSSGGTSSSSSNSSNSATGSGSYTRSSQTRSNVWSGLFWAIIPVVVVIITLAGSSKSTTKTATTSSLNTNYASLAADNSTLIIRWHKSAVTSVFWDNYLSQQYSSLFGNLVYAVGQDGKGAGWDSTGKGLYGVIRDQFGIFNYYASAALSSTGNRAIATREDDIYIVDFWKDAGGGGVWAKGHTAIINTMAWSSDGKILSSGSDDRTVRLWDSTGKQLASLNDSAGRIKSVAWSPDSKLLAAGAADGTILIWKASGELVTSIKAHNSSVNSVAWQNTFSDSYLLASASEDQTIGLWDSKGRPVQVLSGHKGAVNSVAWSPDGKKLASGSADQTIRIWNAQGAVLNTLTGHNGVVNSVAWSPDGKLLASGSSDTTVRIWKQN
jgi:serine/threonine protein kinase